MESLNRPFQEAINTMLNNTTLKNYRKLLFLFGFLSLTSLSFMLPLRAALANQDSIEFLHWWNSAGEVKSIDVLNTYLNQHNLRWPNQAPSYGTTAAYLANIAEQLKTSQRPDAAMMVSSDIRNYERDFSLLSLDAVAEEQNWDEVVPYAIQDTAKHRGHWISAPINSHSTNWLWINKELFSSLSLPQPETWDDLIAVLEAAKARGIPALATLNDDWEQTLLFELVVMSTGGLEFYRRFFVDLQFSKDDQSIIKESFIRLKQLSQYFTAATRETKWHQQTALLAQDKLLMQIHGSWVNSELTTLGAEADQDYICLRFPGTQGAYLFHSDHVVFFNELYNSVQDQHTLARILLDKEFQRELSIASGASPARVDIETDGFNSCSKKSIHDLRMANMRRAVMASLSSKELFKVVADYLEDQVNAETAAKQVIMLFTLQSPLASSQ